MIIQISFRLITYQIDREENPVYIKDAYKMLKNDDSFQNLFEKAEKDNQELAEKHEIDISWGACLVYVFNNVRLHYKALKLAEKNKTEK